MHSCIKDDVIVCHRRMLQYSIVQSYSTVQYGVWFGIVEYGIVQYGKLGQTSFVYNIAQYSLVQYRSMFYSRQVQCSPVQYNVTQYSKLQHNLVWYSSYLTTKLCFHLCTDFNFWDTNQEVVNKWCCQGGMLDHFDIDLCVGNLRPPLRNASSCIENLTLPN